MHAIFPANFILTGLIILTYLASSTSYEPVTVAEQSKACTVFARSEAGIVGSNLTQDMDV
jgi:hypothetical protein